MTPDEVSDASEGPSPLARPAAPIQVELSRQQRALLRALQSRDKALALTYHGAVWVLSSAGNPDRLAQCAHSIRELMEKLPGVLDVPVKAQKESLKVKVQEIESAFADVCRRSSCREPTLGWAGDVDAHLSKFLDRLGAFFTWFKAHSPRRLEELRNMLDRLDASGRSLPEPLAKLNVAEWDQMRDFFQSVAHHRREVNEAELVAWLDSLERFLLDAFVPRTFDDFEEIDGLLSGGAK
jgi:hypothetical protein